MYKERIGIIDDSHKFLLDNEYIHTGYRLYFNTTQKILKSVFLLHNETVNIWTHLIGTIFFTFILFYFIFSTDYSANSAYYLNFLSHLQKDFSVMRENVENKLSLVMFEINKAGVQELENSFNSSVFEILAAFNNFESSHELPIQGVKRWPLLVFIISALICLIFSVLSHLFGAHSKKVKSIVNSLDYAGISILICGSFFPPIYYMFYCDQIFIYIYLITISVSSVFVFCITFSRASL